VANQTSTSSSSDYIATPRKTAYGKIKRERKKKG